MLKPGEKDKHLRDHKIRLSIRVVVEVLLLAALLYVTEYFYFKGYAPHFIKFAPRYQFYTEFFRQYLHFMANTLLVVAICSLIHFHAPLAWEKPLILAASIPLVFSVFPLLAGTAFIFFPFLVYVLFLIPGMSGSLRNLLFASSLFLFNCCMPWLFRFGSGASFWQNSIAIYYLLSYYFFRLIYWYYERSTRMEQPPLIDFLSYFFAVPFLSSLTPSYSYTQKQKKNFPHDPALSRNGLKTIRYWTAALVVWISVSRLCPNPFGFITGWTWPASRFSFAILLLASGVNFIFTYYFFAIRNETSVGAARLLGYDIQDGYRTPILATSPADFWRRWNIYRREFLINVFYYPVVLNLTRKSQKTIDFNHLVACFMTFFGSLYFSIMPLLVFDAPYTFLYRRLWSSLIHFLLESVEALAVGIALVVERRRIRVKYPYNLFLKWGIGLPFTFAFYWLLMGCLESIPSFWSGRFDLLNRM